MLRKEPGTAQQLACSFNVTTQVTLAITEERSGSVDACSQRCSSGLSRCHTKLMKTDYMHMESVALNTPCVTSARPCTGCTLSRKKKEKNTARSFSTVDLSKSFFIE